MGISSELFSRIIYLRLKHLLNIKDLMILPGLDRCWWHMFYLRPSHAFCPSAADISLPWTYSWPWIKMLSWPWCDCWSWPATASCRSSAIWWLVCTEVDDFGITCAHISSFSWVLSLSVTSSSVEALLAAFRWCITVPAVVKWATYEWVVSSYAGGKIGVTWNQIKRDLVTQLNELVSNFNGSGPSIEKTILS